MLTPRPPSGKRERKLEGNGEERQRKSCSRNRHKRKRPPPAQLQREAALEGALPTGDRTRADEGTGAEECHGGAAARKSPHQQGHGCSHAEREAPDSVGGRKR